MKYEAVLPLVTYPDPNSDEIAANATAVARQFGAGLHGLAMTVDIPPVSNVLSRVLLDVPEKIREAEALSRERGKHLLAAVAKHAEAAGLDLSTEEIATALPLMGETAAANVRYFDLALLGWEAGNPTSRMLAEAVVFGSGRPAILLPDQHDADTIDHVAIAWDASRVAARALADARPFLDRARKISILTVLDEKPLAEKSAADRLAESQRRRGLQAKAVPIRAEGRPIGTTLQEHAVELGAGLLVMGGYGHSRMRDFVLGGATEGILTDLRLPALLSH